MSGKEAEYHRHRASDELNLGLSSSSLAAARSHLRLSSLHLQRLRELEASSASERPPFIL